jgi:hypothetical protein
VSLLCSLLARKAASGVAGRGAWMLHTMGNPADGAWVEDDAGQQRRHAGCACMRCCLPFVHKVANLWLKMSQAALLDGVTVVECGVRGSMMQLDTFGGSQLLCKSSGICSLKDSAFKNRNPPVTRSSLYTCCCSVPAMCVLHQIAGVFHHHGNGGVGDIVGEWNHCGYNLFAVLKGVV